MATNVFVSVAPVVVATRLIGLPVRVRATPVSFGWSFGDGGTLDTADPGHPYPVMTTTHTYQRAGVVQVGLRTAYAGEYSVAGGPWVPIDGVATVASPLVPVQVVEAHAVLVAGPTTPSP